MQTTTIATAFTFVHKPGCRCSSEHGGTYADRLSRLRHGLVAQHEGMTLERVCEDHYPDGCCLDWGPGEGWPADHRDYHLLALYRAAIAARTTRETTAARDASGALALALQKAPWGAQPDGTFLTRQTAYGVASGRYAHTLHAPAKRGPLAEALDPEAWSAYQRGDVFLTGLRTFDEARAVREAERAKMRTENLRYDARRRAAAAILAEGGSLAYAPGQMSGTVCVDGEMLSARGVLRTALALHGTAVDVQGAESLIDGWLAATLGAAWWHDSAYGWADRIDLKIDGVVLLDAPRVAEVRS